MSVIVLSKGTVLQLGPLWKCQYTEKKFHMRLTRRTLLVDIFIVFLKSHKKVLTHHLISHGNMLGAGGTTKLLNVGLDSYNRGCHFRKSYATWTQNLTDFIAMHILSKAYAMG